LEILLHEILDEEVDTQPPLEQALLPSVLSFLSSFPQYLDIVVQCTRKTEVRSWRTLFSNLPPPEELFEESLQKGNLKTAGGYLLVLHTFEELRPTGDQVVRLFERARDEQDWELCKELALRSTLELVELRSPSVDQTEEQTHFSFDTTRLSIPTRGRSNGHRVEVSAGLGNEIMSPDRGSRDSGSVSPGGRAASPVVNIQQGASDYFGQGSNGTQ
jgi:hypothetical protein